MDNMGSQDKGHRDTVWGYTSHNGTYHDGKAVGFVYGLGSLVEIEMEMLGAEVRSCILIGTEPKHGG